jgi:hypothetical protein
MLLESNPDQMKFLPTFRIPLILFLILFLTTHSQSQNLTALLGGTLMDGFGGTPMQDSVIIIEGKHI